MEFKPTPYTKQQFLSKLVIPKDPTYGNPNQIETELKPGEPELNRAYQTSLKGDTSKTISIGLQDIDETISYYFSNVIKPTALQNNRQIQVPIIYGSPEKWKAVQADGYYRDDLGKIMVPLIMFQRETITKDRSLGNKLDGNKTKNFQYFEKPYSSRNYYDNFSVLRDQKRQKEFILGIIPDYLIITYKCIIFTDFIEDQMNPLIEAFEFASDSYWGDPERFLFRAKIDNFPTITSVSGNGDRANKSEFTITVNAYIIPSGINTYAAGPNPLAYNITKTFFKERTT